MKLYLSDDDNKIPIKRKQSEEPLIKPKKHKDYGKIPSYIKKYELEREVKKDEGDFNFIYQIPQILYSSLISGAIKGGIKFISLSEKKIRKNIEIYKKEKLLKYNVDKIIEMCEKNDNASD